MVEELESFFIQFRKHTIILLLTPKMYVWRKSKCLLCYNVPLLCRNRTHIISENSEKPSKHLHIIVVILKRTYCIFILIIIEQWKETVFMNSPLSYLKRWMPDSRRRELSPTKNQQAFFISIKEQTYCTERFCDENQQSPFTMNKKSICSSESLELLAFLVAF